MKILWSFWFFLLYIWLKVGMGNLERSNPFLKSLLCFNIKTIFKNPCTIFSCRSHIIWLRTYNSLLKVRLFQNNTLKFCVRWLKTAIQYSKTFLTKKSTQFYCHLNNTDTLSTMITTENQLKDWLYHYNCLKKSLALTQFAFPQHISCIILFHLICNSISIASD